MVTGIVVGLVLLAAVALAVRHRGPAPGSIDFPSARERLGQVVDRVNAGGGGEPAPAPLRSGMRVDEPWIAPATAPSVRPRRPPVARHRSRDRHERRRRAAGVAAVVGIAVAAVALLALWPGATGDGPGRAATEEAAATVTVTSAPVTTPAPLALPIPIPLEPAVADAQQATYPVAPGATVVVSAREPCWMGVSGPDGEIAEQRTLQPGEQHQLEVGQLTRLRLGNPTGVDVAVDGTPANVPAAPGLPFDVVLDPAGT